MAIVNRQAAFSHESSGSDELSERQERDMTNQTYTTGAARFILHSRSKLLVGLRVVPVAAMLFGIVTMAPAASATSCYQPSNIAVNGGRVSNETTLDLSADGGVAVSTADGGDNNFAQGGNGGLFGNGGDAAAGNAGVAVAEANGGMIDLDDINSGNNRGNTIAVSAGSSPCRYGPSNVLVNGGTVSNETTLRLSADGGVAVASADGGDGNFAQGGNGGLFGNGGAASAGLGGVAVAQANGGAISVGDVNSGNNRGNTIVVGLGGGLFGSVSNARIDGGTVSNSTTIAISADGGTAVSSADGGDNNAAIGGNGGILGNGGDAAAGNGGVAVAEANGGAVTVGDINSGGNSGNTIVVQGVQGGNVAVDGGTVTNETTIDISADGGTAVATADGGDGNFAQGGNGGDLGNGGDAAAGNGGTAVSEANGGTISIGDVNSGGNSGNTIIVGS
jgi:hypothetical protein